MRYERGVCKECGHEQYIVNKTRKLCNSCNRKRLAPGREKKAKEKQERKPYYPVRVCSGCGQERGIISKKLNLCRMCSNKRSTWQNRKKVVERRKIKPIGEFGFRTQVEAFKYIWRTRKHVSEISGQKLDYEPMSEQWFMCFFHILPKGQYTLWKTNPDNIILTTPEEHIDWHNVPWSQLRKQEQWIPIFERYEQAKINYREQYPRGK